MTGSRFEGLWRRKERPSSLTSRTSTRVCVQLRRHRRHTVLSQSWLVEVEFQGWCRSWHKYIPLTTPEEGCHFLPHTNNQTFLHKVFANPAEAVRTTGDITQTLFSSYSRFDSQFVHLWDLPVNTNICLLMFRFCRSAVSGCCDPQHAQSQTDPTTVSRLHPPTCPSFLPGLGTRSPPAAPEPTLRSRLPLAQSTSYHLEEKPWWPAEFGFWRRLSFWVKLGSQRGAAWWPRRGEEQPSSCLLESQRKKNPEADIRFNGANDVCGQMLLLLEDLTVSRTCSQQWRQQVFSKFTFNISHNSSCDTFAIFFSTLFLYW